MFNLKPIALVSGTVVCAVGFLLFIPLITELIYKTESWQSYAVPILLYLIVGGSLVITNRNIELRISTKEAFVFIMDKTSDQLDEICLKYEKLYKHVEWLWSHPENGEDSTPKPVIILQSKARLQQLREKVGYEEDIT